MSDSPRTTICLIGPVPPIRGGIAQHTARVAEALAEDAGVHIVSWRNQYPRRLYGGGEQIDPAAPTVPAQRFLSWWNPVSWIRAALAARRSDLVVIPWVVPYHALTHLTIWLVSRRPIVVHVHNPVPHESFPGAGLLARLVLGRATALVCHADAIRDELRALGVTRPCSVVPHPPDVDIVPTEPPVGPPRVLLLGHLRHYKGTDVALDAARVLVDRGIDIHVTIAGQPWGDTDWQEEVARRELGERVTLSLGYVDDDDLGNLLAAHHLLVAPYRSATQSGVIALAIAANRPVVATNVGGLADLVAAGRTGVLVPPEDPEALADGIEEAFAVYPTLVEGVSATNHRWSDVAAAIIGSGRERAV